MGDNRGKLLIGEESERERIIVAVRIPQLKLVLGMICEEYICEVKTLCAIFGVCDFIPKATSSHSAAVRS
jgi:hypothetical protein